MKRLSIKLRITLWYAGLMLLAALIMMGFMMAIGGTVAQQSAQSLLMQTVEANLREVEWDDGAADVDNDFAVFRAGVYSSVYNQDGKMIYGQLPEGLTNQPAFASGQMQTASGSQNYLVYDIELPGPGQGQLWVRGYLPATGAAGMVTLVTRTALITLPLVVLLAALGGYVITKRAFAPLQQMNRAATAIGNGQDLSQRIALGEGHDEIHQLGATFNGMLGRLQGSFEDERRFVADASHELRTPTAVILAQCEYAQGLVESPEEIRESLTVIGRQAGRMSRLITQLLALSRGDRGGETLHPEDTDLGEFFALICEDLRAAAASSTTLHTQFPTGLCAPVDRLMMARLLENLVQNAYQYGKEGGNIWASLALDGPPEEPMVVVQVQDDGPGLPPEDLPRIWRRFYRADTARSGGCHSGLGLSMVQQIAQLHGGTATAQSTPGAGCLFTVRLPQNPTNAKNTPPL